MVSSGTTHPKQLAGLGAYQDPNEERLGYRFVTWTRAFEGSVHAGRQGLGQSGRMGVRLGATGRATAMARERQPRTSTKPATASDMNARG